MGGNFGELDGHPDFKCSETRHFLIQVIDVNAELCYLLISGEHLHHFFPPLPTVVGLGRRSKSS